MTTILDSALTMPRTCVAADQVIALDSVGSTNTYAAELVRKGALFGSARRDGLDGCDGRDWTGREIVAICADEQTAGRGRLDHQWTSAVGESFIVSLVVSVPTAIVRDTSVNGWLQMIAGCEARNAIIAAIRDCGSPLGKDIVLKWPNDIFVDGKKLGGVLAEMVPLAATPIADGATGTTDVAAATERVGIVFGIGLNLTVPEDHLPTDKATSLQLVAHGLPDSMTLRDMIAAHLVDGLRSRLADFEADPQREATRAMEEMRPVCWTLGKPCEAHFVDGTTLRGAALELNPDASLTIRDDNGNLHTVHTADVGVLPQ